MKHERLTDDLRDTAMLYAAGALERTEREAFVRHLEEDRCLICIAEVKDFEAAAQSMAIALPEKTPSENVRKRLLAQAEAVSSRARQVEPPRQRSSIFAWTGWLAAASTAVATVLVITSNTSLRDQVTSLNSRVVELEGQMSQQRLQLVSLTSPDVRVINLAGQGDTPGARGRIFWNEAERTWRFNIRGLAPTTSDRSYQLWFVPTTGNPVSASVFNTNPDGSIEIDIPVPPDVVMLKAAAVTTEPAGGSPQPTSGFALLGAT
jgi:anti-sigma-K factor RskA